MAVIKRHKSRRAAQRTIRDSLRDQRYNHRREHGQDHDQDQVDRWIIVHKPRRSQRRSQKYSRCHPPGHKKFTMGKVNHEQYAIDHRIPKGDQCI